MPSLSLKPSGRRNLRLRCYTEVGWREFSTVLYSMCVSDGAVLCSALLYTTVPSTDTTAVGLTWCSQDGPGGGLDVFARGRYVRGTVHPANERADPLEIGHTSSLNYGGKDGDGVRRPRRTASLAQLLSRSAQSLG